MGKKEAAIDLEVVLEYGCDVRDVAGQLRERVASEVDKLAGRKVVEIDLDVIDVHLPEKLGRSDQEDDARDREVRRVV